jgi:hypothetical protein
MAQEQPTARRHWRTWRRIALGQLGQAGLLIGAIALTLIGLSALAIMLQAQRDETRPAGWIIAVASGKPDAALVEHIVAQQRRGFAPRVLVIGANPQRLADQLNAAGVAASDLDVAETTNARQQLAAYASALQAAPPVVIIAAPEELLLYRKISRDLGIVAFTSAPRGQTLRSGATLAAALAYWRYALLGQP